MTEADHGWEPPSAGTDAEQLVGSLDRLCDRRYALRDGAAELARARLGAGLAEGALDQFAGKGPAGG
jgi:hypothetical protein